MSLVGLDVDSTRARAVAGPRSRTLSLLCLEADQVELPLALDLEGKRLRVGRAGANLVRRRPHLACVDFLAHLGTNHVWSAGRHKLDAAGAVRHVFSALSTPLSPATGIVLAVPAYLDEHQLADLHHLAEEAGWRLMGMVASPLAAALAAYEHHPTGWVESPGLVLVVDVDGHALTWSVIDREVGELHLRICQPAAHLNRNQWLRKLLDGVAQRCVRQSRRDPRESADTEQALYEQIIRALEMPDSTNLVQLRIQGQSWYHHLMLVPEDLVAFVAPLLRQALAEIEALLQTTEAMGGLAGVVVTAAAAALPGLVPALQARLETVPPSTPADEEADFGDLLLSALNRREVRILSPDAVASTAHELAVRIHRGDLPPGRLESLPLPESVSGIMASGPARLNFRGHDHILPAGSFTLGRDPSCDMVFESAQYPHVSGRHCEIISDRRTYTLCDRSRHGTLLNERLIDKQAALHSGDWIRLGPHGPVLRFLGQTTTTR
jgi:hypothetical protein